MLDRSDLISFADQPNIITHVALVPPKARVFVNDISHVLVVCTGTSVLLIGISYTTDFAFNGRLRKEIQLYATSLSVATEFAMSSVVGTADGRIFMCGSQDGHLYELHYQEKEGWFDKRTQLIDHSIGGPQSLFPRLNPPSPIGWFPCSSFCYLFSRPIRQDLVRGL
jgi:nuclear pore complex protein Nup155